MIIVWTLYFFLSFFISLLVSLMVGKRILKIFLFSFSFALLTTFWFSSPGENSFSPIFATFILENTILENNQLSRLIRPFLANFLITLIVSYLLWKKN